MKLKSKMLLKFSCVIALAISLNGCATGGGNAGKGDQIAVKMSSKDYARMKQVEAESLASAEYYKAQATRYSSVSDPTAQLGMRAIDALDSNNRAPTNSNDVEIAKSNNRVESQRIWSGFGKSIISGTIAGVAVVKAADVLGDALTKDSVTVNADNGSTVEGAIGEGNTYTQTNEQVSGILTEPAPVNPITLDGSGGEEGDEPTACVDIRPVLPTDPEGTDANGDGLVCSDGAGGVSDN